MIKFLFLIVFSLNLQAVTLTSFTPAALKGTCTPIFTYTTTNPTTPAYSTQTCNWTKVGPFVHMEGRITYSNKGTGGVGNAQIAGLPFTPLAAASGGGNFTFMNNFTTTFPNTCYITGTACRLVAQLTTANGNDNIDYTTIMTATSDILFVIDYMTNQ